MKICLSSDHHFYHKNIIKYCNRPYLSIEEMHESLIKNWNEVVSEDSVIIHLGDFICGGTFDMVKEIVDQLNGYKILVMGNHDGRSRGWFKRVGFNQVYRRSLLIKNILFSHIPNDIMVLNSMGDVLNIHGHSHKHQYGKPYFNVGVDLHNYKPIEVELPFEEKDLIIDKER